MNLHNADEVLRELNGTLEYTGSGGFSKQAAQNGIDLIHALSAADAPDKWIAYSGHLTLAIYHVAPFSHDNKRAIPQVHIDPRDPTRCPHIKFLLPHESAPWTHTSGYADDLAGAVQMILVALKKCEQREEYLFESLA